MRRAPDEQEVGSRWTIDVGLNDGAVPGRAGRLAQEGDRVLEMLAARGHEAAEANEDRWRSGGQERLDLRSYGFVVV